MPKTHLCLIHVYKINVPSQRILMKQLIKLTVLVSSLVVFAPAVYASTSLADRTTLTYDCSYIAPNGFVGGNYRLIDETSKNGSTQFIFLTESGMTIYPYTAMDMNPDNNTSDPDHQKSKPLISADKKSSMTYQNVGDPTGNVVSPEVIIMTETTKRKYECEEVYVSDETNGNKAVDDLLGDLQAK